MYRSGEMEKPRERGRHRLQVENDMIRRREKEFSYQQLWNGADKYFRHWEKANTKFDSWTSPRYYEDNNKLVSDIRNKKEKEELLEIRRERLRKLLDEDQRSHDIELMVHRSKNLPKLTRSKLEDVPTDVLKEMNVDIKLKEEEKRKREAETKLFNQWRRNNPIIRQYESKYRCKDLKLSWLDQQIEKRMQKEKEEEESKRILKERDERVKKEKEKAEVFKKNLEEKRQQLRQGLDEQIRDLKKKQEISDQLKKKEKDETKRKNELAEILEKQALEERRRIEKECALYNIRQHKMKLKQRVMDIQENLAQEKLLITKLKELDLEEAISDEIKKNEIKEGLNEFLNIVKEQQKLEKQRRIHLDFLFDSEAKVIYEKQTEMWRQEESTRQKLLKQVLDTVRMQIEENIEKNKEKQRQILIEREEMAKNIEEYDKELQKLKQEEEARKSNTKKMLDDDVKVRNARKKQQENLKLKEIDQELDRIRKEEERLQQEILKIQQRRVPVRHGRTRLFY